MRLRPLASVLATLALTAATGCRHPAGRPAPDAGATTAPPAVVGEVLVTVNGVPITREEVTSAARGPSSHGGSGAAETPEQTLDRLIGEELQSQQAMRRGLDREPGFRADLARAEASFREWRRSQLATMLETQEQTARPAVSDADARAYYDANATRIRTEVHVEQILLRDEAAVARALAEVRGGAAFEEVARRQFAGIPDGAGHPWDLGWLRWNLVPAAWRDMAYTLPVGQTSNILRGPNNRFWIIHVIERREQPELTFEAMRPAVLQVVQEERRLSQRLGASDALRRDAHIVFVHRPAP